MLYSKYAKKNKKLSILKAAQRKELDQAREKKMEAQNHEDRLAIEAKTRTNLNKLVADYHSEGGEEKPKAPKAEKMIDLSNKKSVNAAIKKALKAK